MHRGGIFLLRKMRENFLWKDKPFTKGQAWVDLLLQANHADRKVLYGDKVVLIKRGELIRTERQMAKDWGWSRSKVTRFIKLLQSEQMIGRKPNQKASHLIIRKYDELQKMRTNKGTKREPNVNLNKNVKNVEEKILYRDHVSLTEKQYNRLIERFGKNNAIEMLDVLDNYKGAKPRSRKYDSDYHAINSWVVKRVMENRSVPAVDDNICRECGKPSKKILIDGCCEPCYKKLLEKNGIKV